MTTLAFFEIAFVIAWAAALAGAYLGEHTGLSIRTVDNFVIAALLLTIPVAIFAVILSVQFLEATT